MGRPVFCAFFVLHFRIQYSDGNTKVETAHKNRSIVISRVIPQNLKKQLKQE